MNKVILIGRLTRDPEVKTTQNQISYCNFSIAVDRRFKDANGEKQADFINCVAWRQQADLLGRYFSKGHRIGVVGTLQTRSYEVEGQRRYATDVVVDEIDFIETRASAGDSAGGASGYSAPAPYSAPSSAPSAAPSEQNVPSAPSGDSGFFPTMDDDTTLPFDL